MLSLSLHCKFRLFETKDFSLFNDNKNKSKFNLIQLGSLRWNKLFHGVLTIEMWLCNLIKIWDLTRLPFTDMSRSRRSEEISLRVTYVWYVCYRCRSFGFMWICFVIHIISLIYFPHFVHALVSRCLSIWSKIGILKKRNFLTTTISLNDCFD